MANAARDEGRTTVFSSNKEQKEVYRIPSLLYDGDRGVLMAFAERRQTSNDASTEELVMKTGRLLRQEAPPLMSVEWSDAKTVVDKTRLSGYRPMNPCPVYERNSKTLFLVFICVEGTTTESWQRFWGINKARLCYVTTKDGGQTWSDVTNLTEKLPQIKKWATFAVGPGHGVQAESGRLIVPAYAYGSCCPSCFCIACFCAVPGALSLYSDDQGGTWQFGQPLETISIECEMAEVSDDGGNRYVYCNARTQGGFRVEALSDDGGDDFVTLPTADKLVETGGGCQGSVVSFPAQVDGGDSGQEPRWLLYSHPSSKDRRTDLGIYLNKSPKDPNSWSSPWIINQGPSGYSDLAYIDGGRFACLMERGTESEVEQIACHIFSYYQINKGLEE
uniref:exo-alpha-sialidase n=1 Tax=Oryzias sinensis TaxID=183150 RepID=A0A8C7ZVK4_9TELE